MKRSFITPRQKHIFSLFTKIWLIFITSIVLLLLLFNFFVVYKISDFGQNTKSLQELRKSFEAQIKATEQKIAFILRQKALAEEIYANNTILKDSIKNLFDLVPDQITLSKVLMQKNSLIIYGKTPTKDTYNFLLAAPLKSIFHTSNTVFYLTPDGWYNFVSTNKILSTDEQER